MALPKVCQICNGKTNSPPITGFLSTLCVPCNLFTIAIAKGGKPAPELCKPGIRLRITYNVTTREHDGYCSDAGEERSIKSIQIRSFPVYAGFTKKDITDIDTIDVNNHKLALYTISNPEQGCYCGKSGVDYYMTLVEVIEGQTLRDKYFS